MRRYNLSSFELSQSYLFFWDKLEKSNWFLEQIIDTASEDLGMLLDVQLIAQQFWLISATVVGLVVLKVLASWLAGPTSSVQCSLMYASAHCSNVGCIELISAALSTCLAARRSSTMSTSAP